MADNQSRPILGLGNVAMSFSDQQTDHVAVFSCQDDQHAAWLQGKLWADMSWDKLCGPKSVIIHDCIPALHWSGRGLLVLARQGDKVFAVYGDSEEQIIQQLKGHELTGPNIAFTGDASYPSALDFFDLKSLSMYHWPLNVYDLANGWERYSKTTLESRYSFWKDFGFGAAYHYPYMGKQSFAPGQVATFPLEYEIGLARANHQAVEVHFGAHGMPRWMANLYPTDMAGIDPDVVPGWRPIKGAATAHLSAGASPQAWADVDRFNQQVIQRLRQTAGNDLACIRLAVGRPGDEMALHFYGTEYLDHGPAAQRLFQQWLRDDRKMSLEQLGLRWYGDPHHYQSWQDVTILSQMTFYGDFKNGTCNLLEDWYWHLADPEQKQQASWTSVSFKPDNTWVPTKLAPSMEQVFLFGSNAQQTQQEHKPGASWFRRQFDATQWFVNHKGKEIYLAIGTRTVANQPVKAWLNGKFLGELSPEGRWIGPVAVEVTDVLQPGSNVLCLEVPKSHQSAIGMIGGPVFLTTHKPQDYPNLGQYGNARWLDLRDWEIYKLLHLWKRQAAFARPLLPNAALMFVQGSNWPMAKYVGELKQQFGLSSVHFTGGGSSYVPWWGGIAYVNGMYVTTEEGGSITQPIKQSRQLGWSLMNGQGHHTFYLNGEVYMGMENQTQWFSRNKRLFELYGKSVWAKPNIALLMSSQLALDYPYTSLPDCIDLGRGPLQATHFNNVYVTETEVQNGLVNAYPVLFDDSNLVMSDQLIESIEKYVRQGGTFIATNTTGIHSPLNIDDWPIQRLTGYRVLGNRSKMKLEILPQNPLFPELSGKVYSDEGRTIDWIGRNIAGPSIALQSQPELADQCRTIAQWEDGSVAIGLRQLGKGRVITLGSSFWRDKRDTGGGIGVNGSFQTTFLKALFNGLQVPRQIDCNQEQVWARRFVTKNGMQTWLMLYNSSDSTVSNVALSFPWAKPISHVTDLVHGDQKAVAYEQGWARVNGLTLEPHQVCVFGVDHDGFSDALAHWYSTKCRFDSTPTIKQQSLPKTEDVVRSMVLDQFKFRQFSDAEVSDMSWLTESDTTAPWKRVSYGFWDEMGYKPTGIGIYRTQIKVPDAWEGQRIVLTLASYDSPIFLENAKIYVNGQTVGQYNGRGWANCDVIDITTALHAGTNQLAFRVEATKGRGGYAGQMVIFPLSRLASSISLNQWELVTDAHHAQSISLPGQTNGRYLTSKVKIPSDWSDQRIILQWECEPEPVRARISCVVVNGRPIFYNLNGHPYGNIFQVNLYPWIKPGQINTIELWPFATSPIHEGRSQLLISPIHVKSVSIGLN
jgi:hypothetical protein